MGQIENFEWDVKIPDNMPSCEHCTFAWTWINSIGNRKFYSTTMLMRMLGGGRGTQ